jgi:hypothetical protein
MRLFLLLLVASLVLAVIGSGAPGLFFLLLALGVLAADLFVGAMLKRQGGKGHRAGR